MRFRVLASIVLVAPLFISAGGCGSSGASQAAPTVPVKGKVTYKGTPLTKGVVTFEPRNSGRPATGEIGPDGTFELTTLQKGDGAVPGKHRVSVSGTGPSVKKEVVPVKYNDVNTSKIEVEVTADKSDYPIDLN
jgi:hypothetical protein